MRTAVVTGAASGIGAAVARNFLSQGLRVIGVDVCPSSVSADLEAEFGQQFSIHQVDLTSANEVEEFGHSITQTHGALDVLVNCAGVIRKFPVGEFNEEAWDFVHDVNVKAVVRLTSTLIPLLKAAQSARIVNISSMTARIGLEEYSAYGSSKAAVSNLTKVWALELAKYGITVNAVCPGWVNTPMFEEGLVQKLVRERNMTASQAKEFALSYVPQGRLVEPTEVADLVAFLASAQAGAISAQEVGIDCGLTQTFSPNFT